MEATASATARGVWGSGIVWSASGKRRSKSSFIRASRSATVLSWTRPWDTYDHRAGSGGRAKDRP
jgi:hypothetical protein